MGIAEMSAAVSGSFWRAAGINYIKYVNATTAIVRGCVKEGAAKDKMMKTSQVGFVLQKWEAGMPKGSAVNVTELPGFKRARIESSSAQQLYTFPDGQGALHGRVV